MQQTVLDISRLKPLGSKVIVTRIPDDDRIKGFIIPEEYRLNKDAHLFTGVVIAVGDRTKAARFGHDRGCFEPGDKVWWWNLYHWEDKAMVLKDENTGNEYMTIDEADVKAFEVSE